MNGNHQLHAIVVNDADILRRRSRQAKLLDRNEQHATIGSRIAFIGYHDGTTLLMGDVMIKIQRIAPLGG